MNISRKFPVLCDLDGVVWLAHEPIDGSAQAVERLRAHGHRAVTPLLDPADLAKLIDDLARPGDMVVCLGAGSITRWANALPGELARRRYGQARGEGGR